MVGNLRFTWNDKFTESYVKELQIEPEFINKEIHAVCLQLIKKMAVETVGISRNPAVGLYHRFGFVETGVDKTIIEMALTR